MIPHIVTVRGQEDCVQFRALAREHDVIASVRLRRLSQCKSIGWIFGLETLPEHRRQGIADALLAELERYACRTGFGLLIATIWEENSVSRALFAKHGFEPILHWYSPHTNKTVYMYQKPIDGTRGESEDVD